jgi:hypothetical protein
MGDSLTMVCRVALLLAMTVGAGRMSNITRNNSQTIQRRQTREAPLTADNQTQQVTSSIEQRIEAFINEAKSPSKAQINSSTDLSDVLKILNSFINELFPKTPEVANKEKQDGINNKHVSDLSDLAKTMVDNFIDKQKNVNKELKKSIKILLDNAFELDKEPDLDTETERPEKNTALKIKTKLIEEILKKSEESIEQKILEQEYDVYKPKSKEIDQWAIIRNSIKFISVMDKGVAITVSTGNAVAAGPNSTGGAGEENKYSFSNNAASINTDEDASLLDDVDENNPANKPDSLVSGYGFSNSAASTNADEDALLLDDIDENKAANRPVEPQEENGAFVINLDAETKKQSQIESSKTLTQAPSKSSPANASELPTAIVESGVEYSSQVGVGGGVDTKLKAEMKELLDKAKENGEVSQKESKEIQNTMEAYKTTVGSKDELTKMMAPSKTNLYAATNTDEVGKANDVSNLNIPSAYEIYDESKKNIENKEKNVKRIIKKFHDTGRISAEGVLELQKELKEMEELKILRNKSAKEAGVSQEQIEKDKEKDQNFDNVLKLFFKSDIGQKALSMFEPEFADKITNMYLGGLSTEFVFTELFSKYLKDKDRSRIVEDLDEKIKMEKKQDEDKEVRDLIREALKISEATQKDELKFFQDLKKLSEKSNDSTTYKVASELLIKFISSTLK